MNPARSIRSAASSAATAAKLGRRRLAPSSPRTALCAAAQSRPLSSSSAPPTAPAGFSMTYDFPNRKEAPVVTRSCAASGVVDDNDNVDAAMRMRDASRVPPGAVDRFDDLGALSASERSELRAASVGSVAVVGVAEQRRIGPSRPAYIPSNIPTPTSEVPEAEVSTLDNGVRVGSMETYGQVACVGVLSDLGSRHERDADSLDGDDGGDSTHISTSGVNHLLEMLAFQSTSKYAGEELSSLVDGIGGATFASSGREQSMHCIDVLRPNVAEAMDILGETVLRPLITDDEVNEAKAAIEFQLMDIMPAVQVGEGLQVAGYGRLDKEGPPQLQQLGRNHFCTMEALPHLTANSVHLFRQKHLLSDPGGIVVSGAGISHEHLVELAEANFGSHVLPPPAKKAEETHSRTIPSTYTGGEYRLERPTEEGFTRVALAFEVGGWNSPDLVPVCVLQTLLGGGSSFSAGGPGKGMYSRLYREVLNRYHWAESAEAFTSFHAESGLWGISGSCPPAKSRDMVRALAEHFVRLAVDHVTDEELDRARNMLKCNVLAQLESRLVLFEDIGRQILTYGRREDATTMCGKIDAVSKEDIRTVVRGALTKRPTLSTVGDDVRGVPSVGEVETWLAQVLPKQSWF